MTRQEIKERAERLVKDLGLPVHKSRTLTVERHIETAVRATLEDAARAVCGDCEAKLHLDPDPIERWVHCDIDGDREQCPAAAIHDLRAALESEGSNDQG